MGNSNQSLVIVCDLDDTLYLERDYVASGFKAVGVWAEAQLSLTEFGHVAWKLFEAGRRDRIFDIALQELGVREDRGLIQQMVAIYRGHKPAIALRDDVHDFLGGGYGLGGLAIITDGYREAQENKIAALRLDELGFSPIIVTDVWGRDYWKPHPRAFRFIADGFDSKSVRFVYIADNAAKDFLAPNQLGWTTVQISRPCGLHATQPPTADHAAAMRIDSFDQLLDALAIAPSNLAGS
jgi:putative hydrolase of the HAD superfamily